MGSSRYRIEGDYCAAPQLGLRARSTRGPPRQACTGNIGVLSLVVPRCVLPRHNREPGPPGGAESRAGGRSRRVVTLCKLIDLVSKSTLYRSYQNSLASTLAESNVLGISVYNQRPARNFKPYDSTP